MINIVRGIAVYVFFISLLFLILNYFISKFFDNDFAIFTTLAISIIIVFTNITVVWE